MKMIKSVLTGAMISALLSSGAMAANQGSGTITFSGEIIDAPCSIHPDDTKQTIQMGSVSNASLRNDNAAVKNFGIRLVGCDLQKYDLDGTPDGNNKWSGVKAKFTGTSLNNNKLLKISDNVGIELRHAGNPLTFGTASDKMELTGDQELSFQAQVKAVDKTGPISLGEFNSVANFELSYE
ncbi:type 1 fimbrial protein [Escherichia coli]|uniref:fimbrial protein n=1 Tax=Escherichia coli TaxID=562 RepID=UPI0021D1477D|nr:fimbrial protein [Escherichia coli]MCU6343475.1 type 1 fimbrial protein [Escherichia coli]